MKRNTSPGEVPYYIAVFLTSFMQLGLFIHFQRWITFNSEGARFFWLSLLLQFAMFSPSIIMMHVDIGDGAMLDNVIADKYVTISDKVKIQGDEDEPVIIHKDMHI